MASHDVKHLNGLEVATLAGGCFWCIEAAFHGQEGIVSAVSGYIGGSKENAVYEKVASGGTKHREAVQITFDPSVISYEEVLNIFWRQIDPTDLGGQFADRGHQYTTAIYYHSEVQRVVAFATKKEQEDSGRFGDASFVTEILPAVAFYEAEEEHQNYAQKRSSHYAMYKEGSGRAGYLRSIWKK